MRAMLGPAALHPRPDVGQSGRPGPGRLQGRRHLLHHGPGLLARHPRARHGAHARGRHQRQGRDQGARRQAPPAQDRDLRRRERRDQGGAGRQEAHRRGQGHGDHGHHALRHVAGHPGHGAEGGGAARLLRRGHQDRRARRRAQVGLQDAAERLPHRRRAGGLPQGQGPDEGRLAQRGLRLRPAGLDRVREGGAEGGPDRRREREVRAEGRGHDRPDDPRQGGQPAGRGHLVHPALGVRRHQELRRPRHDDAAVPEPRRGQQDLHPAGGPRLERRDLPRRQAARGRAAAGRRRAEGGAARLRARVRGQVRPAQHLRRPRLGRRADRGEGAREGRDRPGGRPRRHRRHPELRRDHGRVRLLGLRPQRARPARRHDDPDRGRPVAPAK